MIKGLVVMSESGWVWFIAVLILILQEVHQLEKQKKEAKDDDKRRDLTQKLELKALEKDLAEAKHVR